jgi:ketosteroid isomerase-like protein
MDDAVDLVRAGLDAYARGDPEESLSGFHPDIVWEVGADLTPDGGVYRGHEGVRAFWEEWSSTIEGFSIEVISVEALPDNRVLAVTRASGTGAASGVPVTSREFVQVFDIENGQVVRVGLHATREAAQAPAAAPRSRPPEP